MNKLSYCLIGDPVAANRAKNDDVMISGLWQWSRAFDKYGEKGEADLIRRCEDLEKYDIVHINMTGGNLSLPQMVRDELGDGSDTKLVVNVDFDVAQWGAIWNYPTMLIDATNCADMLFHVESAGAKIISHALGRAVHTLPHPVDVIGIDLYKKTEREATITTMWHRYIPDCMLPYLAQKYIPLYRVLLGYRGKMPTLSMYDHVYQPQSFTDSIDVMSCSTFGCDLYPGRSYGRSVIEYAALAVPCVCSNTIEASCRCFPDLAVDPYDIQGAHERFKMLMDDDDKLVEVYTYAYEAAGYYSQKNCYNRFVNALEETTI
jgi:glycosyltransferase involved in cell wall biosynthesis